MSTDHCNRLQVFILLTTRTITYSFCPRLHPPLIRFFTNLARFVDFHFQNSAFSPRLRERERHKLKKNVLTSIAVSDIIKKMEFLEQVLGIFSIEKISPNRVPTSEKIQKTQNTLRLIFNLQITNTR